MEDNYKLSPIKDGDVHTSTRRRNTVAVDEKNGTPRDLMDMNRMGKRQQLKRIFGFLTIFGYSVILGSTWEFTLVTIVISLINGGTAGGIWVFLAVCFGMFLVTLSMAEMASMAPTSGGQYHWVSEIAPKKHQKFLSYLVGWMCVLGWQAAMATTTSAATQQLQGLIALTSPSYIIQRWHSTLITIAIAAFAILWNIVFVRKLPSLEGIGLTLHVFGFFTVIVVLWVMGPRSDTKTVWTNFENNSGWNSKGLAILVSMQGPIVTLIGSDSSCHLSEELKDASSVLPKAMVSSAFVNYATGFITIVTVMSTLGVDIPGLLATPLGQPWIQVLLNATESKVGTSIIVAVLFLLLLFCAINQVTTTSRQLFAFARDDGLPFSRFLAHIPEGGNSPHNATMTSFLCTILFSLIYLGSPIAFNVITSLTVSGLLASYWVAVGCMFVKRVLGEPLLPSPFRLGGAGIYFNGFALLFLSLAFVFGFFPSGPTPNSEGMNWSIVIFSGTLCFSLVYYYAYGKRKYTGPVVHVRT